MKDRFKFRVWCKNNKEWEKDEVLISNKNLYLIQNKNFSKRVNFEPENHIINFCTGLKDKNGKLIYEGDIVHKSGSKFNGEKILSEIAWSETSAQFVYSDYIGIGGSHEFRTGTASKMEVLGNIYENPELVRK